MNRLLHAVVVRALPRAITMRFDPSAADDLRATIELAVRDPADGPPRCFTLSIADNRCQVLPGPEPRASARALVGADDLIGLVRGTVTWPELMSGGRFELSGDPFVALRVASLFRLPVSLDPV